MKIRIKHDTLTWFAFITALRQETDKVFQDIRRELAVDENGKTVVPFEWDIDIDFIVGGVPLDFNKFMERFESLSDKFIEDKAGELLREKYGNLMNSMDKIKHRIDEEFPSREDDD